MSTMDDNFMMGEMMDTEKKSETEAKIYKLLRKSTTVSFAKIRKSRDEYYSD